MPIHTKANDKKGVPMSASFETASFVYKWANWCLLASLVIGVISTYLIVSMGNIKEEYLSRDLAAMHERAANAELELAKIRTPRTLTLEQQESIAASLKQFSGTSFDVASDTDKEAVDFAGQIEDTLAKAGWKQVEWTGGAIIRPGFNKFRIGQAIEIGISAQVGMTRSVQLLPIAKAFAAAFTAGGVAARAEYMPKPVSDNDNAVHVIVGKKPQ
jgi:hypothetical protein